MILGKIKREPEVKLMLPLFLDTEAPILKNI